MRMRILLVCCAALALTVGVATATVGRPVLSYRLVMGLLGPAVLVVTGVVLLVYAEVTRRQHRAG